jgi:hypothetical protein
MTSDVRNAGSISSTDPENMLIAWLTLSISMRRPVAESEVRNGVPVISGVLPSTATTRRSWPTQATAC